MSLAISPYFQAYQEVYDKVIANLPDTGFFLKAPFIVPYSEVKPYPFIVTASVGDTVVVTNNAGPVTTFIATADTTQINIFLVQGRNFLRVTISSGYKEILVAATTYAAINAAWAEQFFNEAYLKTENLRKQLNSKFSLKQVEQQLLWQDLLPATRMMRILAGKMAIKSLVNMAPTDTGVLDIASAITGSTPLILPTLVDDSLYEPDSRLLYSGAHDFAGYEFNIWLLNLCSTSWSAFSILLNNLGPEIFELISVTDRKILLKDAAGITESHIFDFDRSTCNIVSILTKFFDCFSRIRVYVALLLESSFEFCTYRYPLDLAVDTPLGVLRFDSGLALDTESGISFDSADDSDPFTDGLLGLSLSCRLDYGHAFDSMTSLASYPAAACDYGKCPFVEPCASMISTSLMSVGVVAPATSTVSLGITGGLPRVFVAGTTAESIYELNCLTLAVTNTIVLPPGSGPVGLLVVNNVLWVMCFVSNSIVLIDLSTNLVTATIPLPFGVTGPIKPILGAGFVWISCVSNKVLKYNPDATLAASYTVPSPLGISYDSVNNRIWAPTQPTSLSCIEIGTGSVTTFSLGASAVNINDSIVINNTVYVADFNADLLHKVNATTKIVLPAISSGNPSPSRLALNGESGLVIIPNQIPPAYETLEAFSDTITPVAVLAFVPNDVATLCAFTYFTCFTGEVIFVNGLTALTTSAVISADLAGIALAST